jgi:hypothetical protein
MEYIAYFMLGFGIGYFTTLGVTKGPSTKLDRMKHDLDVRKEWIRMVSNQKTKNSKWPEGWEK